MEKIIQKLTTYEWEVKQKRNMLVATKGHNTIIINIKKQCLGLLATLGTKTFKIDKNNEDALMHYLNVIEAWHV